MVDVELLGYKINKINMVNNLAETGPLQLSNHMEFKINHGDDDESFREFILLSYTECSEDPGMFFLEIELQGIFKIDNVTNTNVKEEANFRCYDELYYYMEQIMTYIITENTGIVGFQLPKPNFLSEYTDSEGNKPTGESSNGRIIEFKTDI